MDSRGAILYLAAVATGERRSVHCFLLALLAGLALRVAVAPAPGLPADLTSFREWGAYAADRPLASAYREGVIDYPPPYPALLGLMTRGYRALLDQEARAVPDWVLKIPGIAGDVLFAVALFWIERRLASGTAAAVMASIHFLNPAVILDSAVWGQVDVIGSSLVTLAFALSVIGREARPFGERSHHAAWVLLALATIFKAQSIVFAPLLFLLSGIGRRPLKIAASLAAAGAVVLASLAPILLAGEIEPFVRQVLYSIPSRHALATFNAFNVWWFMPPEERLTTQASSELVAGVSLDMIGLALFLAAYAWGLGRLIREERRDDPSWVFLVGGFVAVAFFLLQTRMHERYLYPAIPLLAVAALFRGARAWYALYSLTLALNLLFVLIRHWFPAERGSRLVASPSGLVHVVPLVIAAANTLGFVALALWLIRKGRQAT